MADLSLASDFNTPSYEDWREFAEQSLKGADFEKKLITATYDGLKLQPVYGTSEGLGVPAKAEPGWTILQRVDIPDLVDANAQALRDLESGAGGLTLVIEGHGGPAGFGVRARTVEDFDRLLDGVHLDMIPVRLDAGPETDRTLEALLRLYENRGNSPALANLSVGNDPLGWLGAHGHKPEPSPINRYQADGRIYHNAGASEAQELAFVLAAAVSYLRWLEGAGIALKEAARQVEMLLVVDADMFLSAAKLRAARLLWGRVQEASGLKAAPLKLHAETSWRMMSKLDPHVNLLRATAATFAATVGGADSLSVLAFTSAIGLADRFARRMARNVQLVLAEESGLGHVQDPAAGSGFMDDTALQLANKAWEKFQKIEAGGGLAAAFANHSIQEQIARTRTERLRNIARQKEALIGVSKFPHLAEKPAEVLIRLEAQEPVEDKRRLTAHRLSEPFEKLRDDAARQTVRPSIFLANLGAVADFTARANWAGNLFESGGIEALQNDGFKSATSAAQGFRQSGAMAAVICSSDTVYGEMAAETARALSAAGASYIYLAGQPDESFSAAGVGTFINARCDILSVLHDAHKLLRVSP